MVIFVCVCVCLVLNLNITFYTSLAFGCRTESDFLQVQLIIIL